MKIKKKPETVGQKIVGHFYFFSVMVFGQLLFRSEDLIGFGGYVKSMFGFGGNCIWNTNTSFYFQQSIALLIIGWILAFPIFIKRKEGAGRGNRGLLMCIITPVLYACLLVISLSFAVIDTYQSFIYFQF